MRPCPIMPWTHDGGRMGHIDDQRFAEIWTTRDTRPWEGAGQQETATGLCELCYPKDLYDIFPLKTNLFH